MKKKKTVTLPVYDIIGFLCADDAERVHGSISRCKVGMLSWSPSKTSGWALTTSQELAHARGKKKKMV